MSIDQTNSEAKVSSVDSPSSYFVLSETVSLLPYVEAFVPLYISWMSRPDLLEETQTEAQGDEFWIADQKSLFVSTRESEQRFTLLIAGPSPTLDSLSASTLTPHILLDTILGGAPVGDINGFIVSSPEDLLAHRAALFGPAGAAATVTLELNVMIADVSARRRGLAKAAVRLAALHGAARLGASSFLARITTSNVPSRVLFQSLGYTAIEHSQVFDTTTYALVFPSPSEACVALTSPDVRCWAYGVER